MKMIPQLRYTITDQLHVLRHFSQVDDSYKKELIIKSGLSVNDLIKLMAIPGSKFYHLFAKNPVHLLEKIRNHGKFLFSDPKDWEGGRSVITLTFDKENYPEGIGTDSIIPLDQLQKTEIVFLNKQIRDGLLVNHVRINRLNRTWQVNVVLWVDQEPFIKTIFPGIYAPPFPDALYQKGNELKRSELFWDQHAFINNE